MPVHLDTHDHNINLTPGTTKSDIVAFLYDDPEYGYRPSEVRERLNIPHGTATTTLKRLYEVDYIGKTDDSYYYALEQREILRRYVAGLDQLDRMFTHPTNEGRPSTPDPEGAPSERIDDAEDEREPAELQDELRDQQRENTAERRAFVKQWAEFVRTHSDEEWSAQQNKLIDSQVRR